MITISNAYRVRALDFVTPRVASQSLTTLPPPSLPSIDNSNTNANSDNSQILETKSDANTNEKIQLPWFVSACSDGKVCIWNLEPLSPTMNEQKLDIQPFYFAQSSLRITSLCTLQLTGKPLLFSIVHF